MTKSPDDLHVFEPLKPPINVAEFFLLILALYVGIRTAFIAPEPSSVELLLGRVWNAVWSTSLIGGSALAMLGSFWRGRGIVAVSLMQLGYTLYGFASVARAMSVVIVGYPQDAIVVFLFGVAGFARALQLERRVRLSRNAPTWSNRIWKRSDRG